MSYSISREDVAKMAKLAELRLDDQELESFTAQLVQTLEFAEDLDQAIVDPLPITILPVEGVNVMRPDVVVQPLPREALMAAAANVEENQFRVPPALGES